MKGNGPGVRMYRDQRHNFAYIENDYNVDNDANTVIQVNEVVATNGAKIFLVQLTVKETLELVIQNLELIKIQDK